MLDAQLSTETPSTGLLPMKCANALTSAPPTQALCSTSIFAISSSSHMSAMMTLTTGMPTLTCALATPRPAQRTTSGTRECALASASSRNAQPVNCSTFHAAAAELAETKEIAKPEFSSSTPRLALALASQRAALLSELDGSGATPHANVRLLALKLPLFWLSTLHLWLQLALRSKESLPNSESQPASAFQPQQQTHALSVPLTTTHSISTALSLPVVSTLSDVRSG